MKRLRLAAAVLAILTGLFAALIAQNAEGDISVVLVTAVAAVCLVAVTPFDASAPPERMRVVIACAVYLAMIGIALIFAVLINHETEPLGALITLAAAGVALLVWAFRTRKRVRRSMWSNYYDR